MAAGAWAISKCDRRAGLDLAGAYEDNVMTWVGNRPALAYFQASTHLPLNE